MVGPFFLNETPSFVDFNPWLDFVLLSHESAKSEDFFRTISTGPDGVYPFFSLITDGIPMS